MSSSSVLAEERLSQERAAASLKLDSTSSHTRSSESSALALSSLPLFPDTTLYEPMFVPVNLFGC